MSVGSRRNAVVIGSLLLLCSLGFGGWTALSTGTTDDLTSVHFPTSTQVGYAVGASTEGGGAILKTTDGGTTWTSQSSGTMNGLVSVYFTDDNTGYAVGKGGAAIKTTDGGASWNAMSVGTTDVLNCVVFPGNGQTGFIGVHPRTTAATVLRTTDGGDTWESGTAGQGMNVSITCAMATTELGVCLGVQGFVSYTTNGWTHWDTSYSGANTNADLNAAAFAPTDPNVGYLIGTDTAGTDIGVIRHTSTGVSSLWDSVACWPTTVLYGVDVPTATDAYACGTDVSGGMVLCETAGVFLRTTMPAGLEAIPIKGVCFVDGQATVGYACGGNGTILKTTDGGRPLLPGVTEGKAPAVVRTGIRVLSNPCRHGITLRSDADVRVSVFDATGRVVMSRAAVKGTNFLPLPTGAYFVKAGASTARAVVTD